MSITERRIEPPLGTLVHRTWRPPAGHPLAPFVESIGDCEGVVLHPRERLFPSPALDLVVHLDEPYRVVAPSGERRFPVACVSGILSSPVVMEAPPSRARIVNVRLRPTGARALFGVPLSEVTGRTVDLGDLIARDTSELVDRCNAARAASERMSIIARWIDKRIALRVAGPVAWMVSRIDRHHGAISIDALRDRIGLSWARLAAEFRDQVGVTPKRYARLVRFQRALALAHESPELPLSSLALSAGYYDQAHMTGDFRTFAGITPAEFRSTLRYPDAVSVVEGMRD